MKFLVFLLFMVSVVFGAGNSDSLRLTKALKAKRVHVDSTLDATNITTRERITTSDIQVSDSVIVNGITKSDSALIPILQGNVITRGAHSATVFSGPLIGNVTGSISGGTVSGTTGTFSGAVAVDSLKSTKGIKIGNMVLDTAWNKSGTFACSLFEGVTFIAQTTARYTKTDKAVTISIPLLQGTLTGGAIIYIKPLPTIIIPTGSYNRKVIVPIGDGGLNTIGVLGIGNTNAMVLYNINSTYLSAGSGGIVDACFTYNLN
jgi:hypothetical protein